MTEKKWKRIVKIAVHYRRASQPPEWGLTGTPITGTKKCPRGAVFRVLRRLATTSYDNYEANWNRQTERQTDGQKDRRPEGHTDRTGPHIESG